MRAGVPVVFGYIPVSIAFAILARQAGMTVAETCLMSLGVFTGAGQIMAAGMLAEGAAIVAIIFATFIVNLRYVVMSTCVMNRLSHLPMGLRALSAFGVTDESFAIFMSLDDERATPFYYFGLIIVNYSAWNLGTLIGAVGADLLPEIVALSFGVALYALFIAIIVPDVLPNLRLLALVVMAALSNWVLSAVMDSSLAMVISTLAFALAGVFFVELDDGVDGAGGAAASECGTSDSPDGGKEEVGSR
jgi:4-azaleucine resistance transporter AzlC